MRKRKIISGFAKTLQALKNGEHVAINRALLSRLMADIGKIGNTKLTALGGAYQSAYNKENLIMQPELGFIETPQIHYWDVARNSDITVIEMVVDAYIGFDRITDKYEAAKVLGAILGKYKKIKAKNQMDETGLIVNLIEDLDTAEAKAALATLGLQPVVEFLRADNKKFEDLWNDRAFDKEEKRKYGSVKKARKETDAALGEVTDHISSLYETEVLPDPAQKVLKELIDYFNAIIAEYAEVLAHRHGQENHQRPNPGPATPDTSNPGLPDTLDPSLE